MKPPFFNYLGRLLILCLAATAMLTSCEPEDDDFFEFRPVDFFIDATRLVIDAGQTVTYDDQSNNAVSREWTFDGGTPATSTDATPTVTYNEGGTFLTFVTTTFQDGSTQRRRLEVLVNPPVVADFTATPTALQKGGSVKFNNTTSGIGAIPAVLQPIDSAITHAWFVPGVTPDTIYESNPSIVFPETGRYDVSLTVTRRSTGFTDTEVKTNFIQTFDDPVTQSRAAKFNRDGSAILLSYNESTGALPADLDTRFSLTSSGGGTVAISSVEKPVWADNIVQLNVNPGDFTEGEDYTLSFSDVGSIVVASGSVLLPFDYTVTFLGEMQVWAQNSYDQGTNGNDAIMAMLNAKSFTFDPDGLTFIASGNAGRSVFAQNATNFQDNYHTAASTYSMQIIPGDGATLDDIGDVAIDLAYLPPVGTEYVFSQPITDVRFHNTGGFPAMPEATLSADGKTLTMSATPPRNQNLRMSAILEGQIAEGGFSVSHNAPQGVTTYVTASGR